MLDQNFAEFVAQRISGMLQGDDRTKFLRALRDSPQVIIDEVPRYIPALLSIFLSKHDEPFTFNNTPGGHAELIDYYKIFFKSEIDALG